MLSVLTQIYSYKNSQKEKKIRIKSQGAFNLKDISTFLEKQTFLERKDVATSLERKDVFIHF